jgi:hypothetical protein
MNNIIVAEQYVNWAKKYTTANRLHTIFTLGQLTLAFVCVVGFET